MKLELKRVIFTDRTTIGELSVDGVFFCHTLEDKDRKLEAGGRKVPERTAIPRGDYEVDITFSNRFKKYLPELKNVPQFTGVRIHPGNTENDTEGCILPGDMVDDYSIMNSRPTFNDLFDILEAAKTRGEKINLLVG